MFVAEPLNLMGIMTVSRIIENVHFLHKIAVEDCNVVRIFMFLKVFFESMSVVGTRNKCFLWQYTVICSNSNFVLKEGRKERRKELE